MTINAWSMQGIAIVLVMLGWAAFAGLFVFRKRAPGAPERARDPWAWAGLLMQGAGFGIASWLRRPLGERLVAHAPDWVEAALLLAGVILMFAAVGFAIAAVRTLGRNWSLAARVIEGHELAVGGPYALVRHPIYTAMLGMLVANGLVFGVWYGLVAGIAVYCIGTWMRARREETLLRGAFGARYDAYAQRVPALLPRLRIG